MKDRVKNILELEYSLIAPDPRNPNVMDAERFAAAKAHIAKTGNYAAPVVRELPVTSRFYDAARGGVQFMYLDGHHRSRMRQELGHAQGPVDNWGVMSDDEAGLYLLTLNRNVGEDDPLKRADLLHDITATIEKTDIAQIVPETIADIDALLDLRQVRYDVPLVVPDVTAEADEAALSEETAMHLRFTVYPGQHSVISMAIMHIEAQLEGKNKGARALEHLAQDYLSGIEPQERSYLETQYLARYGDKNMGLLEPDGEDGGGPEFVFPADEDTDLPN